MRVPSRRWSGNLVLLGTKPPETGIDHISPATPFIAVFPKARGLYPLKEFTQLNLNVGVWAMPGDVAEVLITPIKFRGFMIPGNAATFDIGSVAAGAPQFEAFADQFEQVDAIDNLLDPFPGTIKITAAAPTLVVNAQTYTFAGLTAGAGGGHFRFPLTDDFAGFLVTTDTEESSPGNYTLAATLGSS